MEDTVGYGQPPKETQFGPGNNANPNGRPKGPITQFLREYGDAAELRLEIETVNSKGEKKVQKAELTTGGQQTINQAIAARLLQMALGGDMKAIREVLNRTEGRVSQPISLNGKGGGGAVVFFELPKKQ